MSRTLYLLVTSERPDTYLNVVVHGLLQEGVREVFFVHIYGFGEPPPHNKITKRSARVLLSVNNLLKSLAEDLEYRYSEGENAGVKIDLRKVYPPDRIAALQELYRQCLDLDIQWNHRDISYSDLRKEIAAIAAKKEAAIVDVSSVNKKYIGDLIATCLIEGLKSLYTFDLVDRPDFKSPWTMLFHDLRVPGTTDVKYHYINLLDTPVFRECSRSLLVRRPSLSISLIVLVILLSATFASYFAWGPSNWVVQGAFMASAGASIVSLFHVFFPLRH